MNHLEEKKIVQAVEKQCLKELTLLVKRTGIPRDGWVRMAVLAADRTGEGQWERHKEWLRQRAKIEKHFADAIEKLSIAARVRGLSELAGALEPQAKSLRKSSDGIVKILTKNRRKNHGQNLSVLLNSILDRTPDFDCWQPLYGVLYQAYDAAGLHESAVKLSADLLFKMAKRYRKGPTPAG